MMMDAKEIFLEYVCPSMGCLMSAAMYAAPVNELRNALTIGKLGSLNPIPWAVMTGNAIAWCAYAYYSWDPFILASNIPGLIVSIWLNIGASKLQYLQIKQQEHIIERQQQTTRDSSSPATTTGSNSIDNDNNNNSMDRHRQHQSNNNKPSDESSIIVSQESLLLRILILWSTLLVCVGWLDITNGHEKSAVGILANINVVFFYGAPLQTMFTVIKTKSSSSILIPTMIMNVVNTFFWILYGLAKNDPVIYVPNIIGFGLGLIQAILCLLYPSGSDDDNTRRRRGGGEDNNDTMEDPLLQDFQDEATEFSPPISDELL